ncbi:MAG: retropepsin-like aspartic protease [Gillisia sp.]
MKKVFVTLPFIYLFLLSISLSSCKKERSVQDKSDAVYARIDSLIEHKDFFTAREEYRQSRKRLSTFQLLATGAFLDNAFNRPNISAGKVEKLFRDHSAALNDTLAMRLKSIVLNNYIRLYEYKRAKETAEDLLTHYSRVMTAEKIEDHQNMLHIWKALQDQPKQEVRIPREVNLPIIRDKAGLKTIEVKSGSTAEKFVFDTGANFSTITESMAELFQMKMLQGTFEVKSITGDKIQSRVAIAPEIKLGTIIIKNAVFLVFPDEALAFPQIDYQISGIIGFPVIEALNEIQITADDRFLVPKTPSRPFERNLALDFLTPLLLLEDHYGTGTYTFDTGADKTMLYNTYFEKYLVKDGTFLNEVSHNFGGAGGQSSKKGYYITFKPVVHGNVLELDSVSVFSEVINQENKYLGNIGQDFIGKFSKMTINFDQMFVRFD